MCYHNIYAIKSFQAIIKDMLTSEIDFPSTLNTFAEIWSALQCLTGILHRIEEIYLLSKDMN